MGRIKYRKINGITVSHKGNRIGAPVKIGANKTMTFNCTQEQFERLRSYALENKVSKASLIQGFIDTLRLKGEE